MKSLIVWLLAASIAFGMVSCKSKEKAAKEKAAQELAAKTTKAKGDLEALLANKDGKSLEQREKELNAIKSMNLQDPQVKELISKVEAALAAERKLAAEKAKREAEEAERKRKEREAMESGANSPKARTIHEYFSDIVGSGSNGTANAKISEALKLFANENIPVLIIIHEEDGEKDYDKPTTIGKYFNYLKDQKKDMNKIENIRYDNAGKIIELELRKQK